MNARTNAVLINAEVFHAEGIVHRILKVAEKGITEVREVGDFVRITFTSHEDASSVQDLINETIDELAPDAVMLAIA